MRYPGTRVDSSFFDQSNNPGKIRRQRIARSKQHQLAAVHHGRMRESDFLLGDADVNEPPGKSAIVERIRHGLVAPRGIDNNSGHDAASDFSQGFQFRTVPFEWDRLIYTHHALAEIE